MKFDVRVGINRNAVRVEIANDGKFYRYPGYKLWPIKSGCAKSRDSFIMHR